MNPRSVLGVTLQNMNQGNQVLILGEVSGIQNGDGWFTPSDLRKLFLAIRLPLPSNLSVVLSRLKTQGLLIKNGSSSQFSLTPRGMQAKASITGKIDFSALIPELSDTPGAQFASELHQVIPPDFAPVRWQPAINRLLSDYPFETNVFLMTRFPSVDSDPIADVIQVAREVCAEHHLCLHVASDRQIGDEILENVGAYMWACQYGIGVLETLANDVDDSAKSELNDNVLIELGSMLMTGRRCAVLKDFNAPSPPIDLTSQIYKSVNMREPAHVRQALTEWIQVDLGIRQ